MPNIYDDDDDDLPLPSHRPVMDQLPLARGQTPNRRKPSYNDFRCRSNYYPWPRDHLKTQDRRRPIREMPCLGRRKRWKVAGEANWRSDLSQTSGDPLGHGTHDNQRQWEEQIPAKCQKERGEKDQVSERKDGKIDQVRASWQPSEPDALSIES